MSYNCTIIYENVNSDVFIGVIKYISSFLHSYLQASVDAHPNSKFAYHDNELKIIVARNNIRKIISLIIVESKV